MTLFKFSPVILLEIQNAPTSLVITVPLFPTATILFPMEIDFKSLAVFDEILTNSVLPTPTAEKIAPLEPTQIHLSIDDEYLMSNNGEI